MTGQLEDQDRHPEELRVLRQFLTRVAVGTAVAGVVWMAVAADATAGLRPGWFDPDDGPACQYSGGCPEQGIEAALRQQW